MAPLPEASDLDRQDPLGHLLERFPVPGDLIYLDGNSLGAAPAAMDEALLRVADQWRRQLVTAWNRSDWTRLPRRCAHALAPLLGADPAAVAVTDSISVNLAKLVGAVLLARPERNVVLTEASGFPTDAYVLEGIVELAGARARERVPRLERTQADETVARLADDVAVLVLSHVDYRTGARRDLPRITRAAHDQGVLVLWDCAHSAGAIELGLGDHDVDLAVGCTYKYLNAGPGAPAWLYVTPRLVDQLRSPIPGWWGHTAPFDFDEAYRPADGAERFLAGTHSVLAFAALAEALAGWERVDPALLGAKSAALTGRFLTQLDASGVFGTHGLSLVTPRDPGRRGAQISLRHENAWPVVRALADRGVIADHRPPDVIRCGFAPATTRYADVDAAAAILADVLASGDWREPRYQEPHVVP